MSIDCELCGENEAVHFPDSPVIPWTKLGICESCKRKWEETANAVVAVIRELQ